MSFQIGDRVSVDGEQGMLTVAKVTGQRVQLELPNGKKIWRELRALHCTSPNLAAGSKRPTSAVSRGEFVPPIPQRGGGRIDAPDVTESEKAAAIFQSLDLRKTSKSRFDDSILVLKKAAEYDVAVRGGDLSRVHDAIRLYSFAKDILEQFLTVSKSSPDTVVKLTQKCAQVSKRIHSLKKKVTDRETLENELALDRKVWLVETTVTKPTAVPDLPRTASLVLEPMNVEPMSESPSVKSPDVKQNQSKATTPRDNIPVGLVSMRKNTVGMLRRDSSGSDQGRSREINTEAVVEVLRLESRNRTADQIDLVATWVVRSILAQKQPSSLSLAWLCR
eukprot:SAG31_NODE_4485_length_3196_cov_1.445270_3_plen_334_part_00